MVPFMMVVLMLVAVFLIMLVLVQRGRGGGLAGALGGMGGQSAFGTKAGDLFTRITIVVAAIWIFSCVILIVTLNNKDAKNPTAGSSFGANAPKTTPGSTGIPGFGPGTNPTDGLEGTTPEGTGDGATDEPATGETGAADNKTEPPAEATPASESPASETPPADAPAGDAPASEEK